MQPIMPANPFLASPLAGQPWRGFARPAGWLASALLAGLLALAVAPPAAADTVCGRVYTVLSGNRFYMSDAGGQAVPVRLAWTYAPEQPQNASPIAKFKLNQWIGGHDVCVDVVNRDPKGRLVGVVKLKGEDINLKLLSEGLAWHYVQYASRGQDRESFGRYSAAEDGARRQSKGRFCQAV
ncbi:endonuclease YncB(thermonuclease family) [Sulfuritortus calidifontis]|uniref:Endonuclease YncB(Thermonuclease family) n=1 Tax=Sulfuritortus calidifontis TaxID=1914471 RepID=A0A4R3JUU3_9PROT|nr:thermonuclease family protein [Sulfuritortus calidifontis]TCS71542.1 endonuclease YncB(thermonuclease family) [Sulfuritortus calidifontis]